MKQLSFYLFFLFFFTEGFSQSDTFRIEKYWLITSYNKDKSCYLYEYQDTLGNIKIPKGKYSQLGLPDERGFIYARKQIRLGDDVENNVGFINIHDSILIQLNYSLTFEFSHNLACAIKNGKTGNIDRSGKVIIPFIYDGYADFYEDGVVVIKKNNKDVLIDTMGKEIIEPNHSFQEIKENFPNDHILWIQKNNKWAFFDLKGTPLTPFIFDEMYPANLSKNQPNMFFDKDYRWFYKGLIVVQKGDEYGVINEKMDFEVPWNSYQWISPLSASGVMIVKKNNKFGLLNYQLKLIQSIELDTISNLLPKEYDQNLNIFWGKKDGKYYIFDSLGVRIENSEYDSIIHINKNFCLVTKNGENLILDKNGRNILGDKEYICKDWNGFVVKKNSNIGLIDLNGNTIIPFEYEDINSEDENRIFVKKDSKWGVVTNKNKIIIPCIYDYIAYAWDDVHDESHNYIVVQHDKFGKINEKGEEIFPCIYDGITTWVENGPKGHYVMIGDKMGLIEYSGKIIIPIEYESVSDCIRTNWVKVYKNGKAGLCFKNDGSIFLPIEFDSIYVDADYFEDGPIRIVTFKNNVINILDEKGDILKKNVNLKDLSSKYNIEINNYFPFPCTYELFCMIHNRTFKIPECMITNFKKNNYSIESIFYKMERK